ncbi:DUF3089 domain-containing protein [Aridibaculum aurantiacum]|uniref:DUF3089 domain-containing protein n=1 Tax=Aridibaculum aurantiacum TaxID=2810307 RepID=UPI001A960FCA|nr:DUF3089 domain-containing protein [Aridibaculum aurantiacum]
MKKFAGLFIITCLFSAASPAQPALAQSQQNKQQATADAGAPDYSNLKYWASHPRKRDTGDSIPSFLKNEKRDTLADVFFLHPTTYTQRMEEGKWNADVNDEWLNLHTDNRTILNQATIFNGSCRVFAPRYRQVHLRTFFTFNNPAAATAFDVAYEDLKQAFLYYLQHHNNGRPILIAAHSQGSLHAIRLLKEFFDGKPLQKQLVCAYVVGWQIKPTDLKTIPLGQSADATGCIVGWRAYKKGTSDFLVQTENGNGMVVNPLTWTTLDAWAPASLHKGMVDKRFNSLAPVTISAGIDPKLKILGVEVSGSAEGIGSNTNYHVADYNLFYMNVRENVKTRVDAYLKKNMQKK